MAFWVDMNLILGHKVLAKLLVASMCPLGFGRRPNYPSEKGNYKVSVVEVEGGDSFFGQKRQPQNRRHEKNPQQKIQTIILFLTYADHTCAVL